MTARGIPPLQLYQQQQRVLVAMLNGATTKAQIADRTGLPIARVTSSCCALRDSGHVTVKADGTTARWALSAKGREAAEVIAADRPALAHPVQRQILPARRHGSGGRR